MNAEKQYKRSSSNIVQSKQGCRLVFVDNRPETIVQRRVIQKLTALAYAPAYQRPGTDQINAVRHARVPMRGWERDQAATNCGYLNAANAPGNCNHHVPYAMIHEGVENQLMNVGNLSAAVTWATGVNIGGLPRSVIPNTGTPAAPTYDEGTLNTEIDDLIANLANDPQNLFYWPYHTGDGNGTIIDEPIGHGSIVGVGNVRTNLRAYQTLLRGQNVIP